MKLKTQRPATILQMHLLCAVFCQAQRDRDTIRVAILYSDTTPVTKESGWRVRYNDVKWRFAYSVREKHNTAEGVIDPGFYQCLDKQGKTVSCYNDYWVHVEYLDEQKKPVSRYWIVWQSVSAK